jgi:parallel beta-helix repeat protein
MDTRADFLLCATLFLTQSIEAGQNYYVDIGGSDSNPGTEAEPFATIQAGLNAAQPGDTVDLFSGVYRDQNPTFVRSGTTAAPISLQAAPGASVTVSGSDVLGGWTQVGASGVYTHANFTHYFGEWSANPADARDEARNQLFVNGSYVPEVSSQSAIKPGSFYINPSTKTVYANLAGNANPNQKTIEADVTGGPLLNTNGNSNLVIKGLNFVHDANAPQDAAAVQVENGSSNVVIDTVSVRYAAGAGISVTGNNDTIRNSQFDYNGQEGIHASNANNLLVKNSETAYNNTLPGKQFDPGWEAGGNKFAHTTGTVVNGLVSHNNIGSGIWFDVDNQNATIENSISHDNGQGIHYEISYGGKIYNNLVYKNQYKNDTLNFDPTQLEPSAPMAYGIFVSSSAGVQVYNNTAVYNDRSGISVSGPVRDDGNGHNVYSYAADLKNNLVAMNDAYTGSISAGSTRDMFEYQVFNGGPNAVRDPALVGPLIVPFSGNLSDYNLVMPRYGGANPNANSFGFNSWADQTLAQWLADTGQDAHSLIADPLFTNVSANDFSLAPNSPALGRGILIPGLVGSQNIGANFDLFPTTLPPLDQTLPPTQAQAQAQANWISIASTGTWSVAGNWNTLTTPVTTTTASITNNGATAQTVTIATSTTVQHVSLLGSGAPVDLNVPQGVQLGVSNQLVIGTNATLSGAGLILATVLVAGGTVAPGPLTSTLHVAGDLSEQSGSTLAIDLAGTSAQQRDLLAITGNANLAGTLRVAALNGFVPLPGQSFNVITFASHSGDLTIDNQTGHAGLVFNKSFSATGLTIIAAAAFNGDANLDGKVNIVDFNTLDTHLGTGSQNWLTGDFNGDGAVNMLDLDAITSNFGAHIIATQALGAFVPEPSTAFLVGCGIVALHHHSTRRPRGFHQEINQRADVM